MMLVFLLFGLCNDLRVLDFLGLREGRADNAGRPSVYLRRSSESVGKLGPVSLLSVFARF